MNKTVYIIGPYAPSEGRTEAMNVTRAVALGALALTEKRIPIIPHVMIGCSSLLLGRHGHPDADGLAREASYGDRGGLAGMLRDSWATIDAACWVLLNDDGTMSAGTQAEHDVLGAEHVDIEKHTWAGWQPRFEASGLGKLYEEASRAGTGFPRWPGDHGSLVLR